MFGWFKRDKTSSDRVATATEPLDTTGMSESDALKVIMTGKHPGPKPEGEAKAILTVTMRDGTVLAWDSGWVGASVDMLLSTTRWRSARGNAISWLSRHKPDLDCTAWTTPDNVTIRTERIESFKEEVVTQE